MELNKVIQSCFKRGYFIHSSSSIDDSWLELSKFSEKIGLHMQDVGICYLNILQCLKENNTIDTILYFDNLGFGIDKGLHFSLPLKGWLQTHLLETDVNIDHSMIRNGKKSVSDLNRLELENPYRYQCVCFFPTSFHILTIGQVISCLLGEQLRIQIKGALFLVARKSDKIKEQLGNIPYYSLFIIDESGEALFNENYTKPL